MKQIIMVAAVKGGVAKTATAGALAELAARNGERVLLIDLDGQASLSMWYGAELDGPGAYDVITGKATAAEAVQPIKENFSIISGGENLAALQTKPGSATRLYNALSAVKRQFTFAVIDTGPAMNEALNNALFAATGLLIPLETDTNSVQALYSIIDAARHVQQDRPELKIKGAFCAKYDARPRVNRMLRDAIRDACRAERVPYLGEVRNGIAIREAMATGRPLYDYAPKSKPAEDYAAIYARIKGAKK